MQISSSIKVINSVVLKWTFGYILGLVVPARWVVSSKFLIQVYPVASMWLTNPPRGL